VQNVLEDKADADHSCRKTQAGSRQVNSALEGENSLIDTHTGDNESEEIDGCMVVRTYRKYEREGALFFGDGYDVVLQIKVLQTVYVSSEVFLTDAQVNEFVLLGFNRGSGGRVKFISLLQAHPMLESVINVEVLEELETTLEDTSLTPTYSPTSQVTVVPTLPPSVSLSTLTVEPTVELVAPTSAQTSSPSIAPTRSTISPSDQPSVLDLFPSSQPSTVQPTEAPSSERFPLPSTSPTAKSNSTGSPSDTEQVPGKNALVIGATVAGLATIAASCFFVVCVWLPFCSRKNDEESSEDTLHSTKGCKLGKVDRSAVVSHPSEVTTALRGALYKQLGTGNIESGQYDSFDENSVYTSGTTSDAAVNTALDKLFADAALASTSAAVVIHGNATPLSPTMEMEDANDDQVYSQSESDTLQFDEYSVLSGPGASTSELAPDNSLDSSIKFIVETVEEYSSDDSATNRQSLSSSSNEGFDGMVFVSCKDDEPRQHAAGGQFYDRTKGYDPFTDDDRTTGSSRSFAFDFSEVNSVDGDMDLSVCLSVSQEEHSQPSASVHSLVTAKARNTLSQARLIDPTEEEKRDIDGDIREDVEIGVDEDGKLVSFPYSDDYDLQSNGDRNGISHPSESLSKNSLLRAVLEEAGRLSQRNEATPVPFKVDDDARNEVKSSDTEKKQLDEGQAQKSQSDRAYLSRSVSPVPRSPSSPRKKINVPRALSTSPRRRHHSTDQELRSLSTRKAAAYSASFARGDMFYQSHHFGPAVHPSVATEPKKSRLPLDVRSSDKYAYVFSDASDVADTRQSGDRSNAKSSKLGSLPIDHEAMDNPWLFDAIEQTLGPRSPAADMDSISGRSGRSARSNRSNRSHRSHQSFDSSSSGRPPLSADRKFASMHSPNNRPKRRDSPVFLDTNNGSAGSPQSDEEVLVPRSLDNELKRFESGGHDKEANQPSSSGTDRSTPPEAMKQSVAHSHSKNRMETIVPPGKLGVVLADRHDGKGIVVSEIRAHSAMTGLLLPGDRLRK
jgi:hypothetical protein